MEKKVNKDMNIYAHNIIEKCKWVYKIIFDGWIMQKKSPSSEGDVLIYSVCPDTDGQLPDLLSEWSFLHLH